MTSEHGRVVVLTGPSSSGKSSVARDFQAAAKEPWQVLDADVLLAGFAFDQVLKGDAPETQLKAYGRLLNRAFFDSVAAFARQGLDVLCEQVFWSKDTYEDAVACLDGLDVLFVELGADLDIAEKRETGRDDRKPGTSREQRDQLYSGARFDLALDTTSLSPTEAAAELQAFVFRQLPRRRGNAQAFQHS